MLLSFFFLSFSSETPEAEDSEGPSKKPRTHEGCLPPETDVYLVTALDAQELVAHGANEDDHSPSLVE